MPLPDKEPAAIDNYLAVIGEAHNQLPAGIQPEEGVFVSSRVIQNAHDLGLYTLELTSARSTELSSAETQLRISEQRIEELTVESEELRRKLSEAEAKIASVSEPLSRVLQILSAFSNAQEAIPVISTGLELPGQAERQSLKKELVALLSILSVNPIDKTTPDVDSSKAETTLLTPPNVTESTLPDTPELSVPSTDSPVAKAAPGGKKPLGKSHNRSTISSPPISNSPLDSTISKTTQAVEEATHSPIKEAPPHLPESNEGSRTKREETSALINDGDEERLLERVKEKRRIHPKTAEAWLKQNKRNPEAKPTLRKFCEIMGYQQSVAEDLFDYLYENATLALEKMPIGTFKEIIVASSIAQADMQENASSGSDDNDTLNEMESYIVNYLFHPTTDGRQTLEEMAALYKKQLGEHPVRAIRKDILPKIFWKLSKGLAGATYF